MAWREIGSDASPPCYITCTTDTLKQFTIKSAHSLLQSHMLCKTVLHRTDIINPLQHPQGLLHHIHLVNTNEGYEQRWVELRYVDSVTSTQGTFSNKLYL